MDKKRQHQYERHVVQEAGCDDPQKPSCITALISMEVRDQGNVYRNLRLGVCTYIFRGKAINAEGTQNVRERWKWVEQRIG